MNLQSITPPVAVTDIIVELAGLATTSGLSEVVADLDQRNTDLGSKDMDGNTMLHIVMMESDRNPKDESNMIVFDAIVYSSAKWWCKKHSLNYPDDTISDLFMEYKYKAIKHLTTSLYNKKQLNVMELAFKLGNVHIVGKLLGMENVNCFKVGNKTRYDASQLTPLTNEAVTQCCQNLMSLRPSLVEWLLSQKSPEKMARTADILDLEPMKKIEKHYRLVTMLTYLTLMIIHTLYMIIFSYCGVVLMEHKRNTSTTDIAQVRILFFCVVPAEPVCILVYSIYMLLRLLLCRGEVSVMIQLRRIGFMYFGISFFLTYVFIVLAFVYQYSVQGKHQNTILAAALLFGWGMTLALTRGISQVHYLFKIMQVIFLRDVYKILIIYIFVLIGYSLAFHVEFQASPTVLDVFSSPFDTMYNTFNVMVGMGELVPEDLETSLDSAGGSVVFSKVMYVSYIVIATIIMLNLLIAMMNTSYSDIQQQQTLSWRIESVQLGLELERNIMFLARFLPPSSLHYDQINPQASPNTGISWYIEVEEDSTKKTRGTDDLHSKIDRVSQKVELLETRMVADLKRIETLLENIRDGM